jgi:hypothetical protein
MRNNDHIDWVEGHKTDIENAIASLNPQGDTARKYNVVFRRANEIIYNYRFGTNEYDNDGFENDEPDENIPEDIVVEDDEPIDYEPKPKLPETVKVSRYVKYRSKQSDEFKLMNRIRVYISKLNSTSNIVDRNIKKPSEQKLNEYEIVYENGKYVSKIYENYKTQK